MLAVIYFALFALAASAVPQSQQPLQAVLLQGSQLSGGQVPAGAQIVYLQGAAQQYAAPATQGAQIAYIVGAPQTQQYQVQYKAPEVQTRVFSKPAPAFLAPAAPAVPKPLVKEYHVHEGQAPQWAILRQNLDDNFDGHFQYEFETENGIALNAAGSQRQLSPQEQAQVIQGSYSYTAPDGRVITTSYTADENGFVAQGDHLPVAPEEPELPPLIAKSLAYIRSLPPQPENQQ